MFNDFQSFPYEVRQVHATEARLERIYKAAKLGLKGDSLALASGLLPTEYRQLTQLDPIAEMAELKGRADGEMEMSTVLHNAAREGDAKAALEILKHQHGWTAAQNIKVDISIESVNVGAILAEARKRVEATDVEFTDVPLEVKEKVS